MATEVVSDASALVAYLTPESQTEWVTARFEKYSYVHILDLTYYEVGNAIMAKKLKKEISKEDVITIFKKAEILMKGCRIHSFINIIQNAVELANQYNITVYDAAYLTLSKKNSVILLTMDNKLANKLEGTPYHDILEYPTRV